MALVPSGLPSFDVTAVPQDAEYGRVDGVALAEAARLKGLATLKAETEKFEQVVAQLEAAQAKFKNQLRTGSIQTAAPDGEVWACPACGSRNIAQVGTNTDDVLVWCEDCPRGQQLLAIQPRQTLVDGARQRSLRPGPLLADPAPVVVLDRGRLVVEDPTGVTFNPPRVRPAPALPDPPLPDPPPLRPQRVFDAS